MTLKKFSIVASILISIILVTTITLGCITVNDKIELPSPDKFVLYQGEGVYVELTETATVAKYKKLQNKYNSMTKMNVFDCMVNNIKVKNYPSQDVNQLYPSWTKISKTNKFCLKMIYDEKQTIVVNIDGNTKVIEFYSMIMIVENSAKAKKIPIYFSNSTDSTTSYTTSPILIYGKQKSLYKYMSDLYEEYK